MVIEFNQEQFALFIKSHEDKLAKIAWKKYKRTDDDVKQIVKKIYDTKKDIIRIRENMENKAMKSLGTICE